MAEQSLNFPASPVQPPVEPPRRRSRLRRAGRILLFVLGGYYVLCILLLVVYRFVPPPITGVQLQRRVEAWFSDGDPVTRHRFVAVDRLPRYVPRAVVAAEDGNFYRHHGFDFGQMLAAQRTAVRGGRIRGASTITQQLVKNLFGCACRNPLRKIYEVALTWPAELILGKERILELYLNEVEWGPGRYGIDAGARLHYDVAARRLSREQAAGLAALLPNPRTRTPENTRGYRREILRRMEQRGW